MNIIKNAKLFFSLLFLSIALFLFDVSRISLSHISLGYNISFFCFVVSVFILPAAVATFVVRNGTVSRKTFFILFVIADVARYFYFPIINEAEIPFIQDFVFLFFSFICLGGFIAIQKVQNSNTTFSSFFRNSFLWTILSVALVFFIGFKIFLPLFETSLLQASGRYFDEVNFIDPAHPTPLAELRIKNDTPIMLEYPLDSLDSVCVGVYSNNQQQMVWIMRNPAYLISGKEWSAPEPGVLDHSMFKYDFGYGFSHAPLFIKIPPHSDISLQVGARFDSVLGAFAPHNKLSNEIQIYKNVTGGACDRNAQMPLLKSVKFTGVYYASPY
jgi:hypothetical protein